MEGIFFKPLLIFLILKIFIFYYILRSLSVSTLHYDKQIYKPFKLVYAIYVKIFDFSKRHQKVMETSCVVLKTYLLVSYDSSLLMRFQKKFQISCLNKQLTQRKRQFISLSYVPILWGRGYVLVVSGCCIPFLALFSYSQELFLVVKIY